MKLIVIEKHRLRSPTKYVLCIEIEALAIIAYLV